MFVLKRSLNFRNPVERKGRLLCALFAALNQRKLLLKLYDNYNYYSLKLYEKLVLYYVIHLAIIVCCKSPEGFFLS